MKRFYCKVHIYIHAESEKDATQLLENWLDTAEENRESLGLEKYPNDGYCDYIEVKAIEQ